MRKKNELIETIIQQAKAKVAKKAIKKKTAKKAAKKTATVLRTNLAKQLTKKVDAKKKAVKKVTVSRTKTKKDTKLAKSAIKTYSQAQQVFEEPVIPEVLIQREAYNLAATFSENFQNKLQQSGCFDQFLILPKKCKFIVERNGKGVVFIEDEPQYRTIFDRNNTVRIPLPYVVYAISFTKFKGKFRLSSFGVSFSTKSISSFEDNVYDCTLPHTQKNSVCMPGLNDGFDTLSDLVDYFIFQFWNTKFVYNFDRFFLVGEKKITNLQNWSKLNQLDVLKAEFQDPISLQRLLATIISLKGMDSIVAGKVVGLLNSSIDPFTISDSIKRIVKIALQKKQ